MKLFIDTANINDIKKAYKIGILSGVTTNPSIIAKEGVSLEKRMKEIFEATPTVESISVEVSPEAHTAEEMKKEANSFIETYQDINRLTVKLPMTLAGLETCSYLANKGIKTNMTLLFTANQALLAARAGATYVSPFVGRLDDISHDGVQLVKEVAELFRLHQIKSQIIAASVRNPDHVSRVAAAGATIATIPYAIIEQLTRHPLTDQGIEKFANDWKEAVK